MNKRYFVSVSAMTFVIPLIGFFTSYVVAGDPLRFDLLAKWFIFSAVGLRLFIAGLQQSLKPAFTAQEIFHIQSPEALPIVRELGFANLCFGLMGIVSLFKPEWRIVSAVASGLYYGLAALQHLIKRPAGANERFALWTDILIFGFLLTYLIMILA